MTTATTVLEDAPARRRICGADAADLERTFAVEAGAGSGKTTQLVARIVALAERGDVDPAAPLAGVAAITFTRKAAAELRAQLYRGLAKRAAELESVGDTLARRRVRRALAGLDMACIDTIHGFCGLILRGDALSVGLPPDYTIVEGREWEDDRDAFWRHYVAHTPDDALASVGLQPRDVKSRFGSLCERGDLLPHVAGAVQPDLQEAAEFARRKLAEWASFRRDGRARGARSELETALERARRSLALRGTETPLLRAQLLETIVRGWEGGGSRRRSGGAVRPLPPELLADVDQAVAVLLPALRAWQAFAYDVGLAYVLDAIRKFSQERIRGGRITPNDVLQLTARLVRVSPGARRRAAQRFRRFLVDEFQDTDTTQAEVIFLLAHDDSDGSAPEDWLQSNPRPGSLFLVGDPKQSIYRFRRADIRTYEEAVARVVATGGELLRLTTSFRSGPELCAWVNTTLARPFDDDRRLAGGQTRQASYEPLRARPDHPAGAGPAVARHDIRSRQGSEWWVASEDAAGIATFIRAAVDGAADPSLYQQPGAAPAVFGESARYGDFLVLCRSARRFGLYARAFESRGIPYSLDGDKLLGESTELRALVDLLDAIRDPLDGPTVLASRTGLLGGIDAVTLLRERYGSADDNARTHIALVEALVDECRDVLDALPLAAALERIVQRTGLLSIAASRPDDGSTRAGSLLKVVAQARALEAAGLHWTEAVGRLRELVDGSRSDGRMTLDEGTPDAVRVMTVHQAKGLQSPVVFLADPYSSFEGRVVEHLGRDGNGRPFLTAPLVAGDGFNVRITAAPRRWHETDSNEEQLMEDAERRRIAYVAATRAQRLVVVSRYLGHGPSRAGMGPWALFHDGLDEAPSVADLYIRGDAPAPAIAAPLPEINEVAQLRRSALQAAATPTYETGAVTAGETGDDPEREIIDRWEPDARRAGRGTAFGTAVHALFQWAILRRADVALPAADGARAARLWDEFGVGVRIEEGLAALDTLRSSELWMRLSTADQVLTEAPVADERLAGAIDLAFRDVDGWHLVDFKTEPALDDAAAARVAMQYANQLATYGRLWAAAAGAAPASLAVYVTDRGRCFGVSL